MERPQFWLSKLAQPDRLLLTAEDIQRLNAQTFARGLLTDVFSAKLWDYQYLEPEWPEDSNLDLARRPAAAPSYSPGRLEGYTLYTYLKDETERIKRQPRYDPQGAVVPAEVFARLDDNLNLKAIRDSNSVRYGLVRRRTDVRYYPSDLVLTAKPLDSDFDLLQTSSVRAMQPVAILHASRDGDWLFVVTAFCRGWVKRKDVLADCQPEALRNFLAAPDRLLVTDHAVTAVWEPGTTRTAARFYRGTALNLQGEADGYYRIQCPVSTRGGEVVCRTAYLPVTAGVHAGTLPLTARELYRRAFAQLREPYAWGGKGEYQDCSQYLMDLYALFGLVLPRNSSVQALVGGQRILLDPKEDIDARQQKLDSLQGPALLQFPGHVMLYLGGEGGRYYVIHDIWSYRLPYRPEEDRILIIGQVAVSDLSLGTGSTKGSLLQRLTTINLLQP